MKKVSGSPLPLGVTYKNGRANFAMEVPEGKTCKLLLYRKGEASLLASYVFSDRIGSVCYMAVDGLKEEAYEYNYDIDGECVTDSYAKALSGKEVWFKNIEISEKSKENVRGIFYEDHYDWEADQSPRIQEEELIAYAIHVRGFTKHSSSGVAHKGTFDGVTEKLPYLQKLGINQIHLMPVYEFDENQRHVNYWGYGKAYFFAPKASYAAGDPVNEMKSLVRQMHLAGIEVILEMPFTEGTTFSLILDCLRYWVMQYHVDGFIVNPYICNPDELAKDPVLAKSKILKKEDGFQNVMRRFLKGDEGMIRDVICQLKNQDTQLYNYIASHNGFTLCDVVSYDGKHNEANGENNLDGPDYNYSWNCGAEGNSRKKVVNELRKNQIFNAFFLLLFAQGMPCILSGDEFMNTQKGNNNAYCQDNLISWLDWNQLSRQEELYTFVCRLIALRKACMKQIAKKSEDTMGRSEIPQISYHGEDAWQMPAGRASRQLGVFYHEESTEKDFYIAYNMHWLSHSFALPSLPKGMEWVCMAGTKEGVLDEKEAVPVKDKKVQLEERTIKVFVGRRAKE